MTRSLVKDNSLGRRCCSFGIFISATFGHADLGEIIFAAPAPARPIRFVPTIKPSYEFIAGECSDSAQKVTERTVNVIYDDDQDGWVDSHKRWAFVTLPGLRGPRYGWISAEFPPEPRDQTEFNMAKHYSLSKSITF